MQMKKVQGDKNVKNNRMKIQNATTLGFLGRVSVICFPSGVESG